MVVPEHSALREFLFKSARELQTLWKGPRGWAAKVDAKGDFGVALQTQSKHTGCPPKDTPFLAIEAKGRMLMQTLWRGPAVGLLRWTQSGV